MDGTLYVDGPNVDGTWVLQSDQFGVMATFSCQQDAINALGDNTGGDI
jgi:hypothetical protein